MSGASGRVCIHGLHLAMAFQSTAFDYLVKSQLNVGVPSRAITSPMGWEWDPPYLMGISSIASPSQYADADKRSADRR